MTQERSKLAAARARVLRKDDQRKTKERAKRDEDKRILETEIQPVLDQTKDRFLQKPVVQELIILFDEVAEDVGRKEKLKLNKSIDISTDFKDERFKKRKTDVHEAWKRGTIEEIPINLVIRWFYPKNISNMTGTDIFCFALEIIRTGVPFDEDGKPDFGQGAYIFRWGGCAEHEYIKHGYFFDRSDRGPLLDAVSIPDLAEELVRFIDGKGYRRYIPGSDHDDSNTGIM
jgi:hypothetical protein